MLRRHLLRPPVGGVALRGLPRRAGAGPTKSIDYSLKRSGAWNTITYPSSFGTQRRCPRREPWWGPTGDMITFGLHGVTVTASVDGGTVWKAVGSVSHGEAVLELALSVTGGSAGGTLSVLYSTVRVNSAPDQATENTCISVDVTTCPIVDTGALTGTITRRGAASAAQRGV
jgi:hypothetical protein